jgi:hypothetical protein
VQLKVRLQKIRDRMPGLALEAAQIELRPDRSPSPPPVYGPDGKRKNTREERMREALALEGARIVEELRKLNPSYIPPSDLIKKKPFAKIFVPVKEFPSYNFIGLILGPRGNTQKDMESKTGCRISIRGRGSMRDGSRGRISKDMHEAETEDLHVYVTGDEPSGVAAAEAMVRELLKPLDDEANAHKQDQLRQLALINGTLRDEEFCSLCGEKGHKQFECPHRAASHQIAGVKCGICGDQSHPTRDCPFKKDGGASAGQIDHAYHEFLGELEGKGASPGAPAPASASSVPASHSHSLSHSHVHVHAVSETPVVPELPAATPSVSAYSIAAGVGQVPMQGQGQGQVQGQVQGQFDPYFGYGTGAGHGYPPSTGYYAAYDYNQVQGYAQGYGYGQGIAAAQSYMPTHGYDQSYQYAQAQAQAQAQPEGEYDRQWAEYFQQNPDAYQRYLQEQLAAQLQLQAQAQVPAPPPPPA